MQARYKDAHMFSYRTDGPDPTGLANRFWGVFRAEGGGRSVGTPFGCFKGCGEIFHGGKSKDDYNRLFTKTFNDRRRDEAQVGIDAFWEPGEGDTVEVQVDVTNFSDVEFDPYTAQQPGIYMLFYDQRKELYLEGTGRYGRRVPLSDVLPPGETLSMDITLEDVTGFNRSERTLKFIVWLDYKNADDRWEVANVKTAEQGARPAPPGSAPEISIVNPSEGEEFVIGDDVVMEAEVSDLDEDLVQVDFYIGTAKIGEATSPPWVATWEAAGTGAKTIEAHARDAAGWTTKSDPVTIRVRLTRPASPTPDPSEPTAEPTAAPPEPTEDVSEPQTAIYLSFVMKAYALR